MKRLFLNTPVKEVGESISFDADTLHHLKVLRVSDGDSFLFSTYPDSPTSGVLSITIDSGKVYGRVESLDKSFVLTSGVFAMFCALTKGDRNETVIQKLSELGVQKLIFFTSERCVVKGKDLSESKKERFIKIAKEAASQCGRAIPLEVLILENELELRTQIDSLPDDCVRIIGALLPDTKPLNQVIQKEKLHAFVVGPEGDLTKTEYDFFCNNFNFKPVSLGSLVLRTDTAAIAAAAAIQLSCANI